MITSELLRWIGILAGGGVLGFMLYTYLLLLRNHLRNPQLTKAKLFLRFRTLHRIHKHGLEILIGLILIGAWYSAFIPPTSNLVIIHYQLAQLILHLGGICYAIFLLRFVFKP